MMHQCKHKLPAPQLAFHSFKVSKKPLRLLLSSVYSSLVRLSLYRLDQSSVSPLVRLISINIYGILIILKNLQL